MYSVVDGILQPKAANSNRSNRKALRCKQMYAGQQYFDSALARSGVYLRVVYIWSVPSVHI